MMVLLHIIMPENPSSCYEVATELMDRMGLCAGGSKRFAINSQVAMIGFAFGGQQATWLLCTSALRFQAQKKCRQRSRQGALYHSLLRHCNTSSDRASACGTIQSTEPETRFDSAAIRSLHTSSFALPILHENWKALPPISCVT
jgi:hypothetical protein